MRMKLVLPTLAADNSVYNNWSCSQGNTNGTLCENSFHNKKELFDNTFHDVLQIHILSIQK